MQAVLPSIKLVHELVGFQLTLIDREGFRGVDRGCDTNITVSFGKFCFHPVKIFVGSL